MTKFFGQKNSSSLKLLFFLAHRSAVLYLSLSVLYAVYLLGLCCQKKSGNLHHQQVTITITLLLILQDD